jgi:UDP-N-acetylglucosamine 2-epimerase
LAAYYQCIPVGHVEAGLRSGNKYSPFPEEMNRTLTDHIADLRFTPTLAARDALLAEGIPTDRIWVTGNTVIDALLYVLEHHPQPFALPALPAEARVILVTAHRRESFGAPLRSICNALVELATRYLDVHLVYPVHPNPNVQRTVRTTLRGFPNIHLIEPLQYASFCALMQRSVLILTDSGGIQEEAPTLGKPVLVMREVTERTEGIAAGTARLVGTDRERIVAETSRLLDDPIAYAEIANTINPYGDGHAADRIMSIIAEQCARSLTN